MLRLINNSIVSTYFKIAFLFVLAAMVFFSVPLSADFGWYEAGRHAMDGIFYRDILLDGSIFNAVDYSMNYYSYYPAIAPAMYPPFFGFFESAVFTILGAHPWTARLAVIFFLAFGAWGLVRLTEDICGKRGAFYSGLVYISIPLVIYWSRDVMLEAPTTALIIWSFVFYLSYLKYDRTKDLALCFLFAIFATYTKQPAIFVFPALILSALLSSSYTRIIDYRFLLAVLVTGLIGLPLAYITLKWGTLNIDQALGELEVNSLSLSEHLFFYFKRLPSSLGLPILVLSCLGGITLFTKYFRRKSYSKEFVFGISILLCWAILIYLQMFFINLKEARFGFFWMPIFAILAAAGLEWLTAKIFAHRYRAAISLLLILGVFSYNLSSSKMNWSEGFRTPALYLKNHWDGTAVLINFERDPSFVFHMRTLDPDRKFRVYRSSKIFESTMIRKSWGVKSFIENKEELLSSLGEYGIRYVLLGENIPNPTKVESFLREIVETDKFEQVKQFPVVYPDNVSKTLTLYKYQGEISDPGNLPVIHLPVVGIEVKNIEQEKK